jgi:hypothetical protein
MGGLDSNPIVQILGQEWNGWEHWNNMVMFFYCVTVANSVNGSKNWVHRIALTFLRAYGSMHLCMNLVMGGMPGDGLKNLDACLKMCFYALAWNQWFSGFIPNEIGGYMGHAYDWSYSIVKGNAAAAGYAVAASALPGNQFAGFLGAYIGVQGHRLVEHGGLKSMNVASFDADDLLAILGGPAFFFMTGNFGASALVARAGLVMLHVSTRYVDYNGMLSGIAGTVDGIAGGKRSRSRSPK